MNIVAGEGRGSCGKGSMIIEFLESSFAE